MNIETLPSWPTYSETHKLDPLSHTFPDYYFIYDLNYDGLSYYLNKWFKTNPFYTDKCELIYSSVITVKKTDEETTYHLYGRKYNPVSICIVPDDGSYHMRVILRSIDDSSYKIYWNDDKEKYSIDELNDIRYKLIDYISKKTELNGNNLLDYCVGLGGEVDSIDYN